MWCSKYSKFRKHVMNHQRGKSNERSILVQLSRLFKMKTATMKHESVEI